MMQFSTASIKMNYGCVWSAAKQTWHVAKRKLAIRDSTLPSVFVRVLSLLLLCRRGLKEVGVSLNLVLEEGALKTKH